jgi:predicted NBD/HSP70 family sugar kinase
VNLKGDPTTTRALNRRLILNLLRQEGPRSRAELATLSGLSPAAVTFVVADLVEEGIVKEGEAISGMTGRRPIPVQIDYNHGIAVGFKLMLGAVECVATDLATNPIAAMRLGLEDHSPDAIADVLARAVPRLVALAQRPEAKLAGIGISMPGVISNDQTSCVRSNRFDWNNVPLAQMVATRVSAPVWLEDDTNAYAIAQQLFGLGRQHRNMTVLAVGVGIACAQIIEGKLYRGANGAAGKMGHSLFERDGRPCECGKGPTELRSALVAEDPVAVGLVEEAGRCIGTALANITNVTDPEVIVAGGEAVSLGDHFLRPLRKALADGAFRSPPPLLLDWKDNSWARGAAALVTQRMFDFELSGGAISRD